ncbi:MAG: diaminopimelate epimerase, partial [Oscillospiraceae bacterium]|nr:diaminopimelate epimerase [Oscillospiraceae bacterium]
QVIDQDVTIGGRVYPITCVSMGNPHCVVFFDDIDHLDLAAIGDTFEYSPLFPDRVNTEFVKPIDEHTIKMRVWERGSGETLACGTGACAAAVASVLNGYCKKGEDIRVILPGGDLTVNYTDETVYLSGGAEKVFEGTVEI